MKIYILYPEQQILRNTGPFYSDTQISCLFLKQEASLRMLNHSFTGQIMYGLPLRYVCPTCYAPPGLKHALAMVQQICLGIFLPPTLALTPVFFHFHFLSQT